MYAFLPWLLGAAVLAFVAVGVVLSVAIKAMGDVEEHRRLGLNEIEEPEPPRARGFEPVMKKKQ
jgi:hypothetical protein